MATPRETLLDSVMVHVARHGLTDLSLRELASAVGTSHRMLLYHFGSREGLVAAIVETMEDRQRTTLRALAEGATSPADLVRTQWAQLTDPAVRPFIALFFEVLAMAVHARPGTEDFLEQLTDPWLDAAGAVSVELGSPAERDELRLGIAVVRGLLVEVLATGDLEGPTAALELFLSRWERQQVRPDPAG